MKSAYAIDTLLGTFHAVEQDGVVTALHLPNSTPPALEGSPQTNLAQELTDYLDGKRKTFTVPFACDSPAFHQKVWQALAAVSYGETVTYGLLASMAGRSGAARAVGQAMAKNPLPILIPCHRVVYGHGKRQSYAGGAEMKEFLLGLERNNK